MKLKSISCLVCNIIIFSAILSSCTKETSFNSRGKSMLYISPTQPNPRLIEIEQFGKDTVIHYSAKFSGFQPVSEDVTVSFKVQNALVDSFNKIHGTQYEPLGVGNYKFDKTGVVSKGTSTTPPLNLTIVADGLLPSVKYLLPLCITNASNTLKVNKNLNTAYFIVWKNRDSNDTTTVFFPYPEGIPMSLTLSGEEPQIVTYSAQMKGTSPGNDVQVTFEVDTTLTDKLNLILGTDYPSVPKGSYDLVESTIFVPEGATEIEPLKIKLNTPMLGLNQKYVLPVRISDLSGDKLKSNLVLSEDSVVYFLIQTRIRVSSDKTYMDIDKSDWVVTADSYQGPGTGPAMAIDGTPITRWHTEFKPVLSPLPHWLKVKMSTKEILHGFYYVPWRHQVPGGDGVPKKFRVEVSKDGSYWKSVGNFVLQNKPGRQHFYLQYAVQASYFKIVINSTYNNKLFTHIGEFGSF